MTYRTRFSLLLIFLLLIVRVWISKCPLASLYVLTFKQLFGCCETLKKSFPPPSEGELCAGEHASAVETRGVLYYYFFIIHRVASAVSTLLTLRSAGIFMGQLHDNIQSERDTPLKMWNKT